ncbi:MAG: rod shape-determining protein MreC [Rhodospirillales bacterium]|nr:rod shape-determining protein MreC [Rhodospirillales bacterium]HIJ43907.1 rod shape-determining protein MreC [Rhodospirillaceae bacterium]MDP7097104.1 rod shape-determining protein MreC [Rhodospirillales bacterium]MDP7216471.1 rod shape-determining protein MreC [Rhodospirillales bacterium]HIJ92766.1 rod shape-determining protein MreC [Rhodospirillaceae bacterium]
MREHPRSAQRVATQIKGLAQRFAYLGLVGAAFSLMLLGKADVVMMERLRAHVTDAVAPILDALSRPVATASEMVDQVRELARLRVENSRLREDKARLLQWQAVARRLETENKALQSLLNFVPGPKASFVTARVIADSGGVFANSLVVNAGSRVGIAKGQTVITGDGLVGRIAGVGVRSARILLTSDLNSRIPVLVGPTRIRAILAGDNSNRPHLIHLPAGVSVSPGDRVVTSGHGGAFPPDLPIGAVTSVGDGGIEIRPFVKRHRLEYVRVIDFGLAGLGPGPAIGGGGPATHGPENGKTVP